MDMYAKKILPAGLVGQDRSYRFAYCRLPATAMVCAVM